MKRARSRDICKRNRVKQGRRKEKVLSSVKRTNDNHVSILYSHKAEYMYIFFILVDFGLGSVQKVKWEE